MQNTMTRPPVAGVEPDLFEQQAAGLMAQDRLNAQRNSLQERQAYQLANMEMPQVRGEGYSASMPSIFETLAVMAQRNKGNQQIKAMQQQAEALRGELGTGRRAELEMKQQQQQAAWDQNRLMAEDARNARGASNRYRGQFETWIDDAGNKVNVGMTDAGPVDTQGRPVNLEGFTRHKAKSAAAADRTVRGLPQFVQKDILTSSKALGTLSDISAQAQKFRPIDYESLNEATLNTAISAATPAEFENYVANNLKSASPAVRGYLEAIYAYSAQRRKDLSGSALTRMEKMLSDMFLPSANGNNFADIMRRIDREAAEHQRTFAEIDQLYGTKMGEKAPIYTQWSNTKAAQNYTPPPPRSVIEQLAPTPIVNKVKNAIGAPEEHVQTARDKLFELRQELGQ